jgi:hypothetical protein
MFTSCHTFSSNITPQSEAKNSWLKLATQEQNQLFFVLLN